MAPSGNTTRNHGRRRSSRPAINATNPARNPAGTLASDSRVRAWISVHEPKSQGIGSTRNDKDRAPAADFRTLQPTRASAAARAGNSVRTTNSDQPTSTRGEEHATAGAENQGQSAGTDSESTADSDKQEYDILTIEEAELEEDRDFVVVELEDGEESEEKKTQREVEKKSEGGGGGGWLSGWRWKKG